MHKTTGAIFKMKHYTAIIQEDYFQGIETHNSKAAQKAFINGYSQGGQGGYTATEDEIPEFMEFEDEWTNDYAMLKLALKEIQKLKATK